MTPPLDPHLATDAERRQQIALFRYGLIADLVQLPPSQRGLYKLLTDKAAREHDIPFSLRRHVAAETMRGWLRDYRCGGFDALMPKVRSDHGDARRIPPAVVDLLCETKDATPALSIPLLIKKVRDEHRPVQRRARAAALDGAPAPVAPRPHGPQQGRRDVQGPPPLRVRRGR